MKTSILKLTSISIRLRTRVKGRTETLIACICVHFYTQENINTLSDGC